MRTVVRMFVVAALALPIAACLPGKRQGAGCEGCCPGGVCPLPWAPPKTQGALPEAPPPPKAEAAK